MDQTRDPTAPSAAWSDAERLQLFCEMLRFETVSASGAASGAYDACAAWLICQLSIVQLDFCGILPESVSGKPVVVAEWTGSDPSLPCVLLNSHYDVVPVADDQWAVPAFEGLMKDGRVYGRGAQDMKCVCVQYIVALQALKARGFAPVRTIRLSFVPDEEIGGADGMGVLLRSSWFGERSVGLALDEGLASESDKYSVFYGERLPWWVKVTAHGNTGHASRFIEATAVEQLLQFAQRALAFREEQRILLHGSDQAVGSCGCNHSVAAKKVLGDVTSLNLTVLRSGVAGEVSALNVIPSTAEAIFDIRISPHTDPSQMSNKLDLWCRECTASTNSRVGSSFNVETMGDEAMHGPRLQWEYVINRGQEHHTTSTDAASNPWWSVFIAGLGPAVEVEPLVFPAATDSRFLRAVGIRALGFSPMRRSPILLHEHNEYLGEDVFLEGCSVYCGLIEKLASQEHFTADTAF